MSSADHPPFHSGREPQFVDPLYAGARLYESDKEATQTASALTGDLNRDGVLDEADVKLFRQLLNDIGLTPEIMARLSEEERQMVDLNGDGCINRDDLFVLCQKIFGNSFKHVESSIPGTETAAQMDKLLSLRQKLKQKPDPFSEDAPS